MGMTIDNAKEWLKLAVPIKALTQEEFETFIQAVNLAVDTMEKYQMMELDYKARLRADMVAMLTELQLEIREHDPGCGWEGYADKNVIDCIIQEKINSLKGE
jgi:hypothetical protein